MFLAQLGREIRPPPESVSKATLCISLWLLSSFILISPYLSVDLYLYLFLSLSFPTLLLLVFAVITICFIAIAAYITISHIYVIIITAIVSSMRTRRLNSASFITLAFRVVRIFEANHPRAFSMEPERISPENGVPGNFRYATTHL